MDSRPGRAAHIKTSGSERGTPATTSRAEASVQQPNTIPKVLPHERVFRIQIGPELFQLSGASLSSDAPSYFSQYFKGQLENNNNSSQDSTGAAPAAPAAPAAVRTLYIDRDPVTFRDISLHLQGYHIQPRDGTHFVRLFSDAQFYSLPKLISQLYDESIFMSIGHTEFQIPRDLFRDPGNSPNFFTLGYAIFFSATPDDLFPGLQREGLIRPPSILPPSVPHRSAATFAELLHLLRGYPVRVRDPAHRQTLLRDCRYFNFKGLEQRLVPHARGYNQARRRDELALRLEDVLRSGVAVVGAAAAAEDGRGASEAPVRDPAAVAWVAYARPFVDERPAELVLEVGGECTCLHFAPEGPGYSVRAEFFRDARARLTKLLEVIAGKLGLSVAAPVPAGLPMASSIVGAGTLAPGSTPLSEDLVRVDLDLETASVVLDGRPYAAVASSFSSSAGAGFVVDDEAMADLSPALGAASLAQEPARKRRRMGPVGPGPGGAETWIVRTGQWRLRIQATRGPKAPVECVLVAVKLDAMTSERAKNAQRGFLADVDRGMPVV
ncbi:hypothetical protein P8C59_005778 [Phyllachora maydis]|uniref:Potassium channel tetramerisation-type BTB domain-containing protein n=1 Tax=Phyllachora maydis TaxID=1825666 RepID=A0AAD9I638_9PEZI|nr:hypothetical protein P8C59_005778 [Phyllachora maydis]